MFKKKRMPRVRTLYHATFPSRVDSIWKEGIIRNIFGVVYMCGSLDEVKQFTHGFNRWAHEFDQNDVTIKNIDGEDFKFPNIIYHDKVAVFKIDAAQLDWEYMNEGTDHHPGVYTAKVYMYGDSIPKTALKEVVYIPFGE